MDLRAWAETRRDGSPTCTLLLLLYTEPDSLTSIVAFEPKRPRYRYRDGSVVFDEEEAEGDDDAEDWSVRVEKTKQGYFQRPNARRGFPRNQPRFSFLRRAFQRASVRDLTLLGRAREERVPALPRMLRALPGLALRRLHLIDCDLSSTKTSLLLTSYLSETSLMLSELTLIRNGLGRAGLGVAAALGSSVRTWRAQENEITDEICEDLTRVLAGRRGGATLDLLDLKRNPLTYRGIAAVLRNGRIRRVDVGDGWRRINEEDLTHALGEWTGEVPPELILSVPDVRDSHFLRSLTRFSELQLEQVGPRALRHVLAWRTTTSERLARLSLARARLDREDVGVLSDYLRSAKALRWLSLAYTQLMDSERESSRRGAWFFDSGFWPSSWLALHREPDPTLVLMEALARNTSLERLELQYSEFLLRLPPSDASNTTTTTRITSSSLRWLDARTHRANVALPVDFERLLGLRARELGEERPGRAPRFLHVQRPSASLSTWLERSGRLESLELEELPRDDAECARFLETCVSGRSALSGLRRLTLARLEPAGRRPLSAALASRRRPVELRIRCKERESLRGLMGYHRMWMNATIFEAIVRMCEPVHDVIVLSTVLGLATELAAAT